MLEERMKVNVRWLNKDRFPPRRLAHFIGVIYPMNLATKPTSTVLLYSIKISLISFLLPVSISWFSFASSCHHTTLQDFSLVLNSFIQQTFKEPPLKSALPMFQLSATLRISISDIHLALVNTPVPLWLSGWSWSPQKEWFLCELYWQQVDHKM